MLIFETLPRGTQTANLDGYRVDVWRMGGGRASWTVQRNADRVYVGGRFNYHCTIDQAKIDAIDCWLEHAHPATWSEQKKAMHQRLLGDSKEEVI